MPGGPLEKDTCREYVSPLLKAAGWADDQIVEQYPITAGRVITVARSIGAETRSEPTTS